MRRKVAGGDPVCGLLYGKQNQLPPGAPFYFARDTCFYTDEQRIQNRVRAADLALHTNRPYNNPRVAASPHTRTASG